MEKQNTHDANHAMNSTNNAHPENHQKIYLREVTLDDAKHIAEWFSDYENTKFMSTVVRCQKHTAESVRRDLEDSDPEFERLFMVCVEGTDEIIGHAGIDDIDFDDKRGEIYFLIGNKAHHGKGHGKRIVHMLLDHAFNKLDLNSIFATATVLNPSSISVLEKNGFKRIGIRRQYNYIDGEFSDEVMLDIIRSEFIENCENHKEHKN